MRTIFHELSDDHPLNNMDIARIEDEISLYKALSDCLVITGDVSGPRPWIGELVIDPGQVEVTDDNFHRVQRMYRNVTTSMMKSPVFKNESPTYMTLFGNNGPCSLYEIIHPSKDIMLEWYLSLKVINPVYRQLEDMGRKMDEFKSVWIQIWDQSKLAVDQRLTDYAYRVMWRGQFAQGEANKRVYDRAISQLRGPVLDRVKDHVRIQLWDEAMPPRFDTSPAPVYNVVSDITKQE